MHGQQWLVADLEANVSIAVSGTLRCGFGGDLAVTASLTDALVLSFFLHSGAGISPTDLTAARASSVVDSLSLDSLGSVVVGSGAGRWWGEHSLVRVTPDALQQLQASALDLCVSQVIAM